MQRLQTRSQFQAVLAGATLARTAHFALHQVKLDAPSVPSKNDLASPTRLAQQAPWVGALVPKRWAKRAVTRNAIKRQIYCVSADFESVLPVAAHVVRLRASFDRAHFISAWSEALKTAVRQELRQLFTRATAASMAPMARDVAA